jgi:hypothetical protein
VGAENSEITVEVGIRRRGHSLILENADWIVI